MYVRQVMDNKNLENVEPQQKNATREENEDDVLLREMVRILVFDCNTVFFTKGMETSNSVGFSGN